MAISSDISGPDDDDDAYLDRGGRLSDHPDQSKTKTQPRASTGETGEPM